MENLQAENCCHKLKHRPEGEKQALLNRLSRLEGQIRGIRAMVEGDRYCVDISNQIMAAQSILKKTNCMVLSAHVEGCVRDAVSSGDPEEKLQELSRLLEKLAD